MSAPGPADLAALCGRVFRAEGAAAGLKFIAACGASYVYASVKMLRMEANLAEVPVPPPPAVAVRLRLAAAADYTLLRGLCGPVQLEGRLERGDLCMLAELNGATACAAWLCAGEDYCFGLKRAVVPGPGEIYNSALYTLPGARGLGIGLAVEAALLAEARRRGFKKVFAFVAADNAASLRLVRSLGFRAAGEIISKRLLWLESWRQERYVRI